MEKADWTLEKFAVENHKLNKGYFDTNKYKTLKPYIKLGEAFNYINENVNIIDIGCGTAWYGVYLQKEGYLKHSTYSGCDISPHMCKLSKENIPNANFFVFDIASSSLENKYDVVLDSAVIQIADQDWKKVLKNMLLSSSKWLILHRLFYTNDVTKIEQVKTYLKVPDIRIHVGLNELKKELDKYRFSIVYRDLWAIEKCYNQGTFVIKKLEE